jgi:hypothetical protein
MVCPFCFYVCFCFDFEIVMANITSSWLGHFDYRPVLAPHVFLEVAKERPGLLFHPVITVQLLNGVTMMAMVAHDTNVLLLMLVTTFLVALSSNVPTR